MTPGEILRAAAARVTPETWCQGELALLTGGRGGSYNARHRDAYQWCAIGHVYAVEAAPEADPALESLRTYLDISHIEDWNDAPDRTADEVRAALLAAADQWEQAQAEEGAHG